jgi:acetyl esterase/lipase
MRHRLRTPVVALASLLVAAGTLAPAPALAQRSQVEMDPERARALYVSNDPADHSLGRNFERDMAGKAETDSIYAAVTQGVVDYQKVTYRSSVGDMDIPAYVFQPLEKRGDGGHAALIWVHGGVHGNWTANYWPFVKEAVERGYVVIAPEYRGSTGLRPGAPRCHRLRRLRGRRRGHRLRLDAREPAPRGPDRVAMMGWSHGGFISLLAAARPPHPFRAVVGIVPVSNLIFRLSYKGPGYQHAFSTQERIRGLPFERRELYVERSPVYQVDHIEVPVLVHLATNDNDVNFVEAEMLVHALQVKKPTWPRRRSTRTRGAGTPSRARSTWRPSPERLARAARLLEPGVDLPRVEPPALPRWAGEPGELTEYHMGAPRCAGHSRGHDACCNLL